MHEIQLHSSFNSGELLLTIAPVQILQDAQVCLDTQSHYVTPGNLYFPNEQQNDENQLAVFPPP